MLTDIEIAQMTAAELQKETRILQVQSAAITLLTAGEFDLLEIRFRLVSDGFSDDEVCEGVRQAVTDFAQILTD